jgi:hypothetical protein
LLGILVVDVVRCWPAEWPELLPVVEFLIYNTPGTYGYTPRDLDRRWSLAIPLEKELQPFQVAEFEPLTDWARNLFRTYKELRAKVIRWEAEASEHRAALANRFRNRKQLQEGMRVGYRDPRQRKAGGRTPWKVPLEPCTVESVSGNKCQLRRADGTLIPDAHAEDIVILPDQAGQGQAAARDSPAAPSKGPSEEEPEAFLICHPWDRRSVGEMLENPDADIPVPRAGVKPGTFAKLFVGKFVLYKGPLRRQCRVGCIVERLIALGTVVVHK